MPALDFALVRRWLVAVARSFDREVGSLCYRFCDDERILAANRQFLGHDYYTDIITFDYSTRRRIAGDMLISLDTVSSNAAALGKDADNELLRVVVHGELHLLGIDDKGPGERALMESHEDAALRLLQQMEGPADDYNPQQL